MEATPAAWYGRGLIWSTLFIGLVVWQGWMTLTLFGPDDPWRQLLSAEPILSGSHPLHLYHGYLGAQVLREHGTLCCYDPAFYAGYPKTPVFDSGSRPAELFLSLAGGGYHPEAYKIGLASCCLLVPFLLLVAARGAGLGAGASCLAVALGLLICWSSPCRELLEAGDLDFLLAALAALAQTGLLVRFHRQAGLGCWAALLTTSCLGWFGQPAVFVLLLPLVLIYYFSVGVRHPWVWHLGLGSALLGGAAINAFWLLDWLDYCWIRAPLQAEMPLLPHRTLAMIWAASLWGEQADRIWASLLLGAALLGIWRFHATRQRPAARLLGLGAAGFLGLAIAGLVWEPLARVATPRLFILALWFASLPAAHGLAQGLALACHWTGRAWRGIVLATVLLGAVGFAARETAVTLALRCAGTRPLTIGLSAEQQALVEAIRSHTTPEARILWEDGVLAPTVSHWSALLPLLTERAFLGGLDPYIEHAYAAFVEQKLAGRSLDAWGDDELGEFCRHYNAGWVVCRSPAASARFRSWLGAGPVATIAGSPPDCLYALPKASFVLKGQARLLHADFRHIALADVVPDGDKVVLSLHYQAGLRVSPSRVQVEKEPDPYDPIPFIRLRLPGPVARLALTWEPP